MKICCQLPVTMPRKDPRSSTFYDRLQKLYARVQRPDTEILIKDVDCPPWDSSWQLYAGLRSFHHLEILRSVLDAEKQGCDGVAISCFFDPALSEARQLLKIPVTGLAEASMHFAYLMGSKFAIICKVDYYTSAMEEQISRYGMEAKAIKRNPVRGLTIPEDQLSILEQGALSGATKDLDLLMENFQEVGRGCVEDGAEVLIMGCGLLSPLIQQAGMLEVCGAALIEPMQASLKLTEMMADLYKAGLPFVSRKSTYREVPSQYILDVLSSRK
ncbi:MAG: aspartate/glutamate racemase family protein [Dehalococcoidales bacterium]|nr:aspartate/glutamate racemase family protein [Dehalococcoidales bacterium]